MESGKILVTPTNAPDSATLHPGYSATVLTKPNMTKVKR